MLKLSASPSWFMRMFLASARGTQKGTRVLEWLASHPVAGSVEFVEVSAGPAAVHGAARDSDIAAAPSIVHGEVLYGVLWDLSVPEDIVRSRTVTSALGVRFGVLSCRGKDSPGGVGPFGRDSRPSRGEARESLCSGECFSKAWED